MTPTIRTLHDDDLPAVLDLAVRAWAPVFASMRDVLAGSGVYEHFFLEWEPVQRRAVGQVCTATGHDVAVAVDGGRVAGFVAARADEAEGLGEIVMLAVAPEFQRRGIGGALTRYAADGLAARGMAVAMVETGGDVGHAPARRTYERAGFTPMPVVRFFATLPITGNI